MEVIVKQTRPQVSAESRTALKLLCKPPVEASQATEESRFPCTDTSTIAVQCGSSFAFEPPPSYSFPATPTDLVVPAESLIVMGPFAPGLIYQRVVGTVTDNWIKTTTPLAALIMTRPFQDPLNDLDRTYPWPVWDTGIPVGEAYYPGFRIQLTTVTTVAGAANWTITEVPFDYGSLLAEMVIGSATMPMERMYWLQTYGGVHCSFPFNFTATQVEAMVIPCGAGSPLNQSATTNDLKAASIKYETFTPHAEEPGFQFRHVGPPDLVTGTQMAQSCAPNLTFSDPGVIIRLTQEQEMIRRLRLISSGKAAEACAPAPRVTSDPSSAPATSDTLRVNRVCSIAIVNWGIQANVGAQINARIKVNLGLMAQRTRMCGIVGKTVKPDEQFHIALMVSQSLPMLTGPYTFTDGLKALGSALATGAKAIGKGLWDVGKYAGKAALAAGAEAAKVAAAAALASL